MARVRECARPGCRTGITPSEIFCSPCWKRLPREVRFGVFDAHPDPELVQAWVSKALEYLEF